MPKLDVLLCQSRTLKFSELDILLCQSRTSYFPRVGRPTRYILTQYHTIPRVLTAHPESSQSTYYNQSPDLVNCPNLANNRNLSQSLVNKHKTSYTCSCKLHNIVLKMMIHFQIEASNCPKTTQQPYAVPALHMSYSYK